MGRSRKPPKLEKEETSLRARIKELELEVARLKKIKEPGARASKEDKKPAKIVVKPCPDCGAEIKCTELPHAVMELCSAVCGFRNVRKK